MFLLHFLVVFLLSIQWISADTVTPGKSGPVFENATIDLTKKREDLNKARAAFEAERAEFENEKRIVENFLKNSEVIKFNVGGVIMYTTKASVLRVADSKLGRTLLNKTSKGFSVDRDGNKFLDFNPTLFRHLLEQLRLFEDGEPVVFYPPLTPSLAVQFNALLAKLELNPAPPSDEDIFTFNVGDEVVQTTRRTLTRVPDSKLASLLTMNKPADMDSQGRPFLDYDPDLFRHLLAQIQAGQTKNFEAPDEESKAAFNVMLNNFGLTPK